MNWFKFYGQDFITDPKIKRLPLVRQYVFVYLLCLASSSGGVIEGLDESMLASMMNVRQSDPNYEGIIGSFGQLEDHGFIKIQEDGSIIIVNFQKRQDSYLTEAERSKRYRERQKEKASRDERHTDPVTDETPNRIDKNRIDNINTNPVAPSGAGNLKSLLEEKQQELVNKRTTGGQTRWQDSADRMAKALGISINRYKEYQSSWFKIFKEADTNPDKNRRIQVAYSWLIDNPAFLEAEDEGRIKMFFHVYHNGVPQK